MYNNQNNSREIAGSPAGVYSIPALKVKQTLFFLLAAGLAITNAQAQKLWTFQYSDSGGWNQPQYGTTIMFGDLNADGRADVCGRGQAGIYCSLSTPSGFTPAVLTPLGFSDQYGWANSKYYTSIRLADVNGDGRADVCGRGEAGIYCSLGKGDGTFNPAQLWTSQYRDSDGWDKPQYGSTIMFGDINGDGKADLCGRGEAGIYCSLSTGGSFVAAVLTPSDFSDGNGWANQIYYSSIRLGDVNGDGKADVCGRGEAGVYCALSKGDGTFNPAQIWSYDFNDAQGWRLIQYGSTLMIADVNGDGKADVCGRGGDGIYCTLSTGHSFGPATQAISNYSDAYGWDSLIYYGSIRLADINGDHRAGICGREADGIFCALATVAFR